MKTKKQVMVGMLSAALLFNGALAFSPAAYADDDEEVIMVKAPLNSQQLISDWFHTIVVRTSGVANKDLSDVLDALAAGQSLIQASGLSEGELVSRLSRLADETVANAANNYSASNEEINKLSLEIKNKTVEVISIGGYSGISAKFDFAAALNDTLASLNSKAMVLAEDDNIDVQDRLNNGATLVEATKLDVYQLTEALQQSILLQIQQAAADNSITAQEASQYKEEALQAIRKGLEAPGGVTVKAKSSSAGFDGKALFKKHQDSIIQDISLFTPEYDAYELEDAMSHGVKISQATGLSSQELAGRLQTLWGKDIEEAYQNGIITVKQRDELLNQAGIEIREILGRFN